MNIRRTFIALGTAASLLGLGLPGTASAQRAGTPADVGILAAVDYQISVATTDIENAGTDSAIRVRLRGTLATSTFVPLDSGIDNFERNTLNHFNRVLPDVGTILSVDVEYTSGGGSPDWHLAHIRVTAPGRPSVYFPAHRWFTSTRTVNVPAAADARTYTIRVTTSDIEDAGSDGKVELRLRGTLGVSPWFHLDNSGVDNFERNTTDTFVRVIDYLGPLQAFDVRWAPAGDSPHWHLAHIAVSVNGSGGGTSTGPWHRWFTVPTTVTIPVA